MMRRFSWRAGSPVPPARSTCVWERRQRTSLIRSVVLTGILATLLPVSAAQAATPVHFSGTMPVVFTDTTTCGFPIDVNLQANVVGTAFFDSQGVFQGAIVENNVIGTDTANGVTLRDATHYVDHYNSFNVVTKELGLDFDVRNGGLVLRDAGYIRFNPDGSVAFIRGPHPFTEGDTAAFCAAFS